ncbi:MAG: hypothetical protein JWP13_813 [Candidatus Saccharibacteria bacterium]|nr:hypothetical protein [Candidatus Saccharibacteria bacterium]
MPTNQKDTIYIDIDDEITAIIDKVRSSEQRIVALVLPKRATVLQSIVNMKLLKKTAENAKKHVVLITSEAGLLPLAGAVGIHVAPSLQSRPMIPNAPGGMAAGPVVDESLDFDPDAVSTKPVGELAGPAAMMADDLETIELDNEEPGTASVSPLPAVAAAAAGKKVKKDSKLKIPDFNKFRLWLVLGGVALVALIIFGYFATAVLPKATVTIATDSSDIDTNANITLDPKVTEMDTEERVLPAKIEQKQQSGSQQAATTGQKNKGAKASGTVTLSLKDCSVDEATIPAGTGVSSGGKTFITQSSATLESVKVGSKCSNSSFKDVSTEEVDVIAQTPGAAYNIAASSFAVAGFTVVTGQSSDAMTGGTDNIVKVVAQSDVDNVKQKISAQDSSGARSELKQKLESAGYTAVTSSLQVSDPVVTPSAAVGDEADTVTVTSAVTYTMYGAKKSDLEDFIKENVKNKIDTRKQQILNLGVDKASFDVNSPASSGQLQVALSATTLAGPDINTDDLKRQIAGKKTNDVRTVAKATPGVTDVSVKYSPFWVSKVPKKESKITVVIEKTAATAHGNQP